MPKKYIYTIVIFLCTISKSIGQNQKDVSQYMFYQPVVNPAAAGVFENFNAAVYARYQWAQIEGAPLKAGFMAHLPFQKSTVGLAFFQEEIGVHTTQKIYGSYTYSLDIANQQSLSFGLSGGLDMDRHDYRQANPNDPDYQFSKSYSNMGANFQFGMYYAAADYYVGFAIPNLVSSGIEYGDDNSYTGKTAVKASYWQYNLHAGYKYSLTHELDLFTSTLIKYALNAPLDIDVNAQVVYQDFIGLGLSYRTKKEFLTMVNIKLMKQLKMAYSYHGYLGPENSLLGAHEVLLVLDLYKSELAKIQSPRF